MMEYDEQALEAGTHDQHLRFEMAYFFYSHFCIPTFATFFFWILCTISGLDGGGL